MKREVGGGIGMGNTCKPMAVSLQCMTKSTTNKKKKKNLPANAEDTTLIPDLVKIPHAVEQLSPCIATTKPRCLESVLLERSHCSEKPAHYNRVVPAHRT